MKKTIAALFLIASMPAAATDYQQANQKTMFCQYAGELSAQAFLNTRDKMEVMEITKENAGTLYAAFKWATEYGITAPDAKNAYMASWSKCMDNFEYLFTYKKTRGVIADSLHY